MDIFEPQEKDRIVFNSLVTHPLQSWEWGEFREKTGIKVIRRLAIKNKKPSLAFQVTIHKIPRTNFTIGYVPKSIAPTEAICDELRKIGKQEKCVFIKLEPNVQRIQNSEFKIANLQESPHPTFYKVYIPTRYYKI